MMRPFRKARPMLPSDKGVRQGRAVNAARAAFGSTEAVLAFLNTDHPGLGGRPIDLALASDQGLAAVEAELALQRDAPTAAAA